MVEIHSFHSKAGGYCDSVGSFYTLHVFIIVIVCITFLCAVPGLCSSELPDAALQVSALWSCGL